MRKAAIFFFSGTGNTWFVAKRISIALCKKDIKSNVYSIDALEKDEINKIISENDLIVFGYPIYASYMPIPMLDFINKIDPVENKETAIFCTQMIFSGDGAKVLDDLISKKGFVTKWADHFNAPNNLNSGHFSFMPITNDREKLKKVMKKLNRQALRFANYISKDTSYLKGFSKFSTILALTQRPANKPMINIWKKSISIETDLCIKCGKCLTVCPRNNIEVIHKNFVAKENCCSCLRCHNFCPANAISFQGKHSKKEHFHGLVKNFDPAILKNFRG